MAAEKPSDWRNKSVTIRGIEYPSQMAAATALGVSQSAIHAAKRRGRLDTVGLGCVGPAAEPVTIRGVTYPSAREAAVALGVNAATVRMARRAGRLDTVGIGSGGITKPVVIGGESFPSITDAAQRFGVRASEMSTYLSVKRKIENVQSK